MKRFEHKIALLLLATTVIPLVVSALMLRGLLRESLSVGVNARVRAQLDGGVEARRERIESSRERFEEATRALAGSRGLDAALSAPDNAPLRALGNDLLEHHDTLVRVAVRDPRGAERFAVGRPGSFPERRFRTREIAAVVDAGPHRGARVVLTWAISWDDYRDFERAGEFARTFGSLALGRGTLASWYGVAFIGALAVVLLVLAGLGIAIARRLTRRLARLSDGIEAVALGDLSIRMKVAGSDEIADLSRSFNAMVSDLRASHRRIAYLERLGAWQEIARRLAHEIKNPLTPIQLAVQEMHKQYKGDDAHYRKLLDDTVEIVQEEIGTLRRLTGEFSSLARLPEVRPVPENVWDFVRDAAQGLGLGDEVQVSCDVPREECLAPLDRMMMKRVLDNLVRNGAESARDKGVLPRVVIGGEMSEDGRRVRILVSDNGPGVPAADRDRVFEPYFTTKKEGMGLGLAIVNKIVLDHGGEITIQDAPPARGGGAEFVVSLPLRTGSRW